jgi:hypothetical protein
MTTSFGAHVMGLVMSRVHAHDYGLHCRHFLGSLLEDYTYTHVAASLTCAGEVGTCDLDS